MHNYRFFFIKCYWLLTAYLLDIYLFFLLSFSYYQNEHAGRIFKKSNISNSPQSPNLCYDHAVYLFDCSLNNCWSCWTCEGGETFVIRRRLEISVLCFFPSWVSPRADTDIFSNSIFIFSVQNCKYPSPEEPPVTRREKTSNIGMFYSSSPHSNIYPTSICRLYSKGHQEESSSLV